MKTTSRRQGVKSGPPSCVEPKIIPSQDTADDVAWFTDDGGNLVGTLTVGNGEKTWGYVILGHDDRGGVLLLDRRTNYRSWQVAELQLLLAMKSARKRRLALLRERKPVNEPI